MLAPHNWAVDRREGNAAPVAVLSLKWAVREVPKERFDRRVFLT